MKQYPKNINLFWLVVLLLGWIFDFLFWKAPIGVNFAIFSAVCLLGGFILLLADGIRPHPKSLWLLIPFFFFSIITFVRREQLTIFLAYTCALFFLGIMVSTYQSGRWLQYILPDYLYKLFVLVIGIFLRPMSFYLQYKDEKRDGDVFIPVWAVLRGLTLALPIVICFASLLGSADLVFNQRMNELFDQLDVKNIFENIFRLLLILGYSIVIAGIFLYAFLESKDERLIGEYKPVMKTFLGFTEVAVVMGSVSMLFLLFVIIQFQYFFGGQSNIGVEGYTYSEYARRGFSELNLVAFFSILLIIGLNIFTRHESERQRRIYSMLSILMVALVIVILISSYQRLALAIDWHGYSRLRLYPRTFLLWVGVLLITVVILQAIRKERFFTLAFVIASMGFAVSLTLINVDKAIVQHNIPRFLQGKNLNVNHLSSLSTDAIPALVEEFNNSAYPTELHEGIGAILLCYTQSDTIKFDVFRLDGDWRSFNLSSWQAHTALEEIESQLIGYKILKKRYPMIVRTPGNIRYECNKRLADF